MFVRASLVRSWFAAPRLVRESGEVVKRLSSARVCAATGKTAARRFEPLKEHPDFEVALDDYELPRSEPPESESDDEEEYEDGVFEEDDQKNEKLSAYQRFQRRHKRPKKPVNRVTQLTREDIPLHIEQLLWRRAKKLPVQIVVGNKGVTKGLLLSIRNHFTRHDIVKVSVCLRWEDYSGDVAQELDERSGGVVIHDGGRRMLIFRGYEQYPVPSKTPKGVKEWWSDLKMEMDKKQAEQEREEQEKEESKGDE